MNSSKRRSLRTLSGAAIASAAACLFLASGVAPVTAADEAKIHCTGVNACKGKAECKTAKNECKGQNACKGQGYLSMSEQDCKAKGGKVQKG